jgi:hypothetical protein
MQVYIPNLLYIVTRESLCIFKFGIAIVFKNNTLTNATYMAEYSLRESVSAQGREGRRFDSDPGRKKKGYILSRDLEVTLSHWSRSIELVITPLIDL